MKIWTFIEGFVVNETNKDDDDDIWCDDDDNNESNSPVENKKYTVIAKVTYEVTAPDRIGAQLVAIQAACGCRRGETLFPTQPFEYDRGQTSKCMSIEDFDVIHRPTYKELAEEEAKRLAAESANKDEGGSGGEKTNGP